MVSRLAAELPAATQAVTPHRFRSPIDSHLRTSDDDCLQRC